MIKRIVMKGVWAFTLIIALPCYSQDNSVFAPFISQLKAEIRNHFIGLSWQDSLDIKGPVYVYRSEAPFSSASSLPIPIKEIPYGEGFYADEAEKPGVLYYFVAASDDWGHKYPLFLPNINMVNVTVNPDNVSVFSQFPASGTAGASAAAASSTAVPAGSSGSRLVLPPIEGISVRVEDDRALISFSGADISRNLILYRSINPIRRPEDLLSAMIIRSNAKSPTIDYPLPGISYYYAVVYEEELSMGLVRLQPGSNVTGVVEISVRSRIVPRDMPLPDLSLSPVPERLILESEAAARAEASIQQRDSRSMTVPEAVIFPEDLTRGASGEEYQLRSIVQGSFFYKEWKNAEDEFRRFLELPREKRNRAKANFYLGQAYYFQNKQREALLSFLDAQDTFPAETGAWIQIVLGSFSR
ncbi:MAG: hypothetical protein LBB72_00860 [Spirochaetaceae bacterium]|jgi:hypothetical protein|nr:hypothetical protein [Spirochaetaceae bacterium]